MAWTDKDEQEYQALKQQFETIKSKLLIQPSETVQTKNMGMQPNYIPSQDPAASGRVEEEMGPITDALTLGVGGATAPIKAIAPQAIRAAKMIPAAKEVIGKGLGRAGEVLRAPAKEASEKLMNEAVTKVPGYVERGVDKTILADSFKMVKGQRGPVSVVNAVNSGQVEMTAQRARDLIKFIGQEMKNKAGAFGKKGDANYAEASKAISKARKFLSENVEGYAKPAKDLSNAYLKSSLLKKAGLGIVGAGTLYAAGNPLLSALKSLGGR
jgi:hypothetical protein